MSKAKPEDIIEYYSRKDVVEHYYENRFHGLGGSYIQNNEISSNLSILKDIKKPNNSVKVLDVGAGSGRLSKVLKKAGYNTHSLDSSLEMAKRLKNIISPKNIIVQSAFSKINRSEKFDVITSLRFFDHFHIKDQKKLLVNFTKSLKNDGVIVFSALNKNSLEYLFSKFFYFGKVNFYYTDEGYKKLFKSLELKVLERDQRFFLPRGAFLYLQKLPLLMRLAIHLDTYLTDKLPSFSASFVYILRK